MLCTLQGSARARLSGPLRASQVVVRGGGAAVNRVPPLQIIELYLVTISSPPRRHPIKIVVGAKNAAAETVAQRLRRVGPAF